MRLGPELTKSSLFFEKVDEVVWIEGPMSVQSGIHLAMREKSQVQWVTGLETQVVDATEQKPISQEFFCHSNLTFAEHSGTPRQYNQRFGGKTHLDWRLFTLVPGRLSIELPQGFGVPIPSDAPLDYVTMSLNLNAMPYVNRGGLSHRGYAPEDWGV